MHKDASCVYSQLMDEDEGIDHEDVTNQAANNESEVGLEVVHWSTQSFLSWSGGLWILITVGIDNDNATHEWSWSRESNQNGTVRHVSLYVEVSQHNSEGGVHGGSVEQAL